MVFFSNPDQYNNFISYIYTQYKTPLVMRKSLALLLLAAALFAVSCGSKEPVKFDGAGDIGDCHIPGSHSYDAATGTYTLTASGYNLWFETDAFYFVWKKVKGDFEITGEVAFKGEGVNPHRKIGFLIRESLDPQSRYADAAIHGEGLTSLQYRPETAGETLESVSESWGPTVVSLIRRGNTISIRTGKGSLPETDDTSVDIALPEECYVGMFMCSHEEDIAETGYLKNVRLIQ